LIARILSAENELTVAAKRTRVRGVRAALEDAPAKTPGE
jgi:hypothetical protein